MEPIRTEIKFHKTACYFCSEWLENDNFKDHLKHCGQVLEKCPNNCNVFVERNKMEQHLKICPVTANGGVVDTSLTQRLTILETDLGSLRTTVNEEIKQRLQLITDIGRLKKHNQISDEWTGKVSDVLNALKKCVNEETQSRCNDITKLQKEIDKLIVTVNEIENWRVELSMTLDQIQANFIEEDNVREKLDSLEEYTSGRDERIRQMAGEVNDLKMDIAMQFQTNVQNFTELSDKVKTLDAVLLGQNNSIQSLKSETRDEMNGLSVINQQQISILTEWSTKNDYEIKHLKHIVCETEDKCEKVEKVVNENKLKTAETRQNLQDLETHLKIQNQLMDIHNTRGHLIWRIDKYSEKLKDAKENDTVLGSPLFCNRQYGYTLRLDVHMNGIGNWKGRNLIARLIHVKGDYDALLQWPCRLEADIILRDQPDDVNQSKNYYKTCLVKKKSENMETNQYIHIPHRTIEGGTFLRDDSIFLEVRVHSVSNR